jgi:chemotaxis protein MotB
MFKKSYFIYGLVLLSFALSGCMVFKSTYMAKAGEAEKLSQDVVNLQERIQVLTAENTELRKQRRDMADNLEKDIAALKSENEKLRKQAVGIKKAKEEEIQTTSKTYENLLHKMKDEIAKGEITISELKDKLTVNVVEEILFASGSAEVKANGLVVL